jgi:hypothetical protein
MPDTDGAITEAMSGRFMGGGSHRPTTGCKTVATPCYVGARAVISSRGRSFFIFVFFLSFTLVVVFFLLIIISPLYSFVILPPVSFRWHCGRSEE